MHSRCIGNDGKPVFASIMCRGRQKLYSEINDHPFAVAVQWHPEMMYDSSEQLKLLRAFVRHQGRRQKHEYLYIWSVQCRTEKDLL
jgi:CTP synthase (UTP-ammonia lyase)